MSENDDVAGNSSNTIGLHKKNAVLISNNTIDTINISIGDSCPIKSEMSEEPLLLLNNNLSESGDQNLKKDGADTGRRHNEDLVIKVGGAPNRLRRAQLKSGYRIYPLSRVRPPVEVYQEQGGGQNKGWGTPPPSRAALLAEARMVAGEAEGVAAVVQAVAAADNTAVVEKAAVQAVVVRAENLLEQLIAHSYLYSLARETENVIDKIKDILEYVGDRPAVLGVFGPPSPELMAKGQGLEDAVNDLIYIHAQARPSWRQDGRREGSLTALPMRMRIGRPIKTDFKKGVSDDEGLLSQKVSGQLRLGKIVYGVPKANPHEDVFFVGHQHRYQYFASNELLRGSQPIMWRPYAKYSYWRPRWLPKNGRKATYILKSLLLGRHRRKNREEERKKAQKKREEKEKKSREELLEEVAES